ncbi:AbgT family transporter [Streptomyces sparsogenes]|uniref:AbgT transporter n=1 Tax=Streptomyces sparsogenes DSM 40356 TaxID=1331668 RepID=A0A1R1SC95_9ACTN|nr:AbgT family transporter [Streptomyces sparsogenes]OMI35913.1 AbgT transporter [Streptomyces sparsogenes DSM 40356]
MQDTTTAPPPPTAADDGLLSRLMGALERLGNRLPHPFYLFGGLFALLAVVSTALAAAHAAVTVPGTDQPLAVKGLLTGEGIRWLLENALTNFTGFPPLGTVLLMMTAVGVAERTGLLEAAVKATIARTPARLLPYVVAFVACQAHVMSDVAILVIPPLAALAFKAAGRNPIAGLIGGFACVCAGYAAGFSVGALDALYSGITEKAVQVLPMGHEAPTHLLVNYFFTAASSVVLALVGGFLTARVLEPRLPAPATGATAAEDENTGLSRRQRRGLLLSAGATAAFAVAVLAAWLAPGSPLRGEGGALVPSLVLTGVVPLLFCAFLIAGVVYGVTAGTITHRDDVPRMMAESVTAMSGYIVLIFVIAQFIAAFTWSNAGTLLAVRCAELLKSAGLTGFTALVLFVLVVSLLNLLISSGSALWSLMAPVFVPTFMLIGLSPALTLAAFRIADSATQTITPLNPYLFLSLALLRRYEPDARLGTLMSRLAVYVLPFIVSWLAVLGIFYALDLPLGPGAGIGQAP